MSVRILSTSVVLVSLKNKDTFPALTACVTTIRETSLPSWVAYNPICRHSLNPTWRINYLEPFVSDQYAVIASREQMRNLSRSLTPEPFLVPSSNLESLKCKEIFRIANFVISGIFSLFDMDFEIGQSKNCEVVECSELFTRFETMSEYSTIICWS